MTQFSKLKILLFCTFFLSSFLLWQKAEAACTGSSPNLTAASPNYADVKDCIDAATYGDTVNIPAGTGTGWTSGVTITKDIKIKGAGINSTFIDIDISSPNPNSTGVFIFEPDNQAETNIETLSSEGLFEIMGITVTGKSVGYVDFFNIPGDSISKVVKKIRIHNNRMIQLSHFMGGEIGYAHGIMDNNFLFHTNFAYVGASSFNLNNRVYPGDGGGWYFEDNVAQFSSNALSIGTDVTKLKINSFTYWLNHSFYNKDAVDGIDLPLGTIPQNKYGIYRVSINANGEITITPGADNFTTGYDSASVAEVAMPNVPEGEADMGYFRIINTNGSFIGGTTALNAAGVTAYIVTFPKGAWAATGGNNRGMASVFRYNKIYGTAVYDSSFTQFIYFDMHSNQLSGITGGQHIEIYGNNLTSVTRVGTTNGFCDIRGQKTIMFYNWFPNTSAAIRVREEYSDRMSYGSASPDPASEAAEAFVQSLNMCSSRTSADGTPRQNCPGYYIGIPDPCNCWKVHDSYFVNNRRNGTTLENAVKSGQDDFYHTTQPNNPAELSENVEFFNYATPASFDGSAGVTCGTVAQMNAIAPTTAGVGFWIPDNISTMPCDSVSEDNIKQTEGVDPVTPISGTLYKWDGDSWEAFWRPYTYPHPLRGESDTIAPAAPSGLSVN